ncbi:MAG: hypothetical protein GX073_08365 [Firmicutes bacterium]|nr:hypothetical protein [Bacillota bacterium]
MRIRARFVSSFMLALVLTFLVVLPTLAVTYYVSYGSQYYTPPTGGSYFGSGSTYQSNAGSYSTKYNSNYSTQYYYYTSSYNNGTSYYVPPKTSTPAPSEPKPSNPAPSNPAPSNPTPVEPKPSNPATPSKGLTAMEQKMVALVNQERTKAGLQQLKVDNTLVQLARMKSQDMIDKNYFSHTSPTYGSPFEMMKNAGVKYYTAGENLAGAGSVESAHASLMASPGHRANILNSRYNYFGVGIATGGPYGNMFTQLFIGK